MRLVALFYAGSWHTQLTAMVALSISLWRGCLFLSCCTMLGACCAPWRVGSLPVCSCAVSAGVFFPWQQWAMQFFSHKLAAARLPSATGTTHFRFPVVAPYYALVLCAGLVWDQPCACAGSFGDCLLSLLCFPSSRPLVLQVFGCVLQ